MLHSAPDLAAAIEPYTQANNNNPKPYVWTQTAEQILEKVWEDLSPAQAAVSLGINEACHRFALKESRSVVQHSRHAARKRRRASALDSRPASPVECGTAHAACTVREEDPAAVADPAVRTR